MTVNVQKIDAMTWEFRVRTIMKSVAPKPDDFASNVEFMGAIIKQGAANAKTPQERAQAAEMLQKLDGARRQAAEAAVAGRAIQPQMDQALAHSPLVGRVGADISSVYWMTRVADRCP
jgi:hypothetical protein